MCGVSTRNIVLRHIVPNVLGVVVVYASLLVPSMILFESFLSFTGLGTRSRSAAGAHCSATAPTQWKFHRGCCCSRRVSPVVTLFCFNFIGDGLRDALDPKDR